MRAGVATSVHHHGHRAERPGLDGGHWPLSSRCKRSVWRPPVCYRPMPHRAPCRALHDVIRGSSRSGRRVRRPVGTTSASSAAPRYQRIYCRRAVLRQYRGWPCARAPPLYDFHLRKVIPSWCILQHEMTSVKAKTLTGVDNAWPSFRSIRCCAECRITKSLEGRAGSSVPGSNDHRDLRLLACSRRACCYLPYQRRHTSTSKST